MPAGFNQGGARGAQFTPGPWEVSQHTKRISIINPRAVHSGSRGGGGKLIAYSPVTHDSAQAPLALANARLIAAAPELYEALSMIRHNWGGHAEQCRFVITHYCEKCNCDWLKVAAQCDAALAKARGEQ